MEKKTTEPTTMEKINSKIEKIKDEIRKKCFDSQTLIDSIENWSMKKALIEEKKKWTLRLDQTNYIQYELNKEDL